MMWCLPALLHAMVLASALAAQLPGGGKGGQCRCVPDQWEGMLQSTDREYDLKSGQSGTAETKLYIHYDYKNRRFVMVDTKTGNKAIADYAKVSGALFTITNWIFLYC